jgi:hypothetical protein
MPRVSVWVWKRAFIHAAALEYKLLFVPMLSAVVAVVGFVVSWACVYAWLLCSRLAGNGAPVAVYCAIWSLAGWLSLPMVV